MSFKIGYFVYLNEDSGVGVVVRTEPDDNLPEDHLAVWFGTFDNKNPEVWTVPADYFKAAPPPVFKH